MSIICRTCGNKIYNMNAKNLFHNENSEILNNIEIVAGTVLKNCNKLPSHICACCLLDLKQAVYHINIFRDRCIKTQEQLLSLQTQIEPTTQADLKLRQSTNYEELSIDINRVDQDIDYGDEFIELYEENLLNNSGFSDDDYAIKYVQNEMHSLFEYNNDSQNATQDLELSDNGRSSSNRYRGKSSSPYVSLDSSKGKTIVLHKRTSSGNHLKTNKMKTKKTYISWKNLTEEQIIDRRRKQRRRDCICDQCGRHFTDQSNFKLHMLRHTGIKNFKCKDCDKLFYTEHLQQLHERTIHRGERPYGCKYCDKAFNSSTTRVMHERSHTNVRPFSCEYCDKSFISTSALKRHDLTHNGVRAFYCKICDKTFQRNTHLKAHLRSKLHGLRETNINSLKEFE